MNAAALSADLERLLELDTPPVAISFCDSPPEGVERIDAPQPAGCGYWRLAGSEGRVFYTEASDHHGCPIGAHTHAVALPDSVKEQLADTLRTMVELEYLRAEDVPRIPTRQRPFAFAIYAPLTKAPLDPGVVLIRARARQLMLLQEAAQSAALAGDLPTMGRPTCAVVPRAEVSGRTAASFGCVGNRVYTGLGDNEAYFAVPGPALEKIVARLEVIARANQALASFHQDRAVGNRPL